MCVLELQDELEVLNHAAAAAFGFLLSVVPALLVSIGLANVFWQGISPDNATLEGLLAGLLTGLVSPEASRTVSGTGLLSFSGLSALGGLFLSALIFVSTIRKGLRLILGGRIRALTLIQAVQVNVKDLISLGLIVLVLAAAEILRALFPWAGFFLPILGLIIFIWSTLTFFPAVRPKQGPVLLWTALISLLFSLVTLLFRTFLNFDQYQSMYGFAAQFVVILFNVYLFFVLYFFAAVFLFVEHNFDGLVFSRHYRVRNNPRPEALDLWLYNDVTRLNQLYGKSLNAGSVLFAAGETGRSAYFLQEGEIGIMATAEGNLAGRLLGKLSPGEIFGETASVLDEPRSATAQALTPAKVLELPPTVLEFFLKTDHEGGKSLLEILTTRLKKANQRMT